MTAVVLLTAASAWAMAGTIRAADTRRSTRRRLLDIGGLGPPSGDLRPDPVAVLGRVVLRRVLRRPPDAGLDRRAGVAVVGVLLAAVVGPVVGAVVVLGAAAPPVLERRRARARRRTDAVTALPDTIDLLAIAARAGLPAPGAVAGVAERAPPPWGPALASAAARAARGERFADALTELDGVGDDLGHPLRSLLRAAAEEGADLVAGLDRLAIDARDLRRRRAEEGARRVPVRLLLPLVVCSLPAFALLTIVPIVAGALGALDI